MIVSYNNSPNQQENWSPRSLAQLIAKRSRGGDDVKCLIDASPIALNSEEVDDDDTSCTVQVQSPQKKQIINHIQANRQALREKQQNNKNSKVERERKDKLRQEKIEKKKQKLYGNVRSRVSMSLSSPSNSSNDCCHSIDAPISRGVSPLSPTVTDSVSSENSDFHIAFGRKVPIHVESRPISGSRPITDADSVVSSTSSRHKSYGKVPGYITQRKERIAQVEQERARKQELEPPEPGLVLLAESERLKTLALLDANEKNLKYDLVNIPFSMNPQRAGRLREALSLRLKEIEDAKAIFSKEKVFVKKDF